MTLIPEPREVRTLRTPGSTRIGGSVFDRQRRESAEHAFDNRPGTFDWEAEPPTRAADYLTAWTSVTKMAGLVHLHVTIPLAIYADNLLLGMLAGDRRKDARRMRKNARRRIRAHRREQLLAAQPSYRGHR